MLKIIAILGPTASGKSQLAFNIAKQISAEIIAVDSATIYRQLDIGTAKPDRQIRKTIPHHLIDIIDPHQTYSVAQFLNQSQKIVKQIHRRGKSVIFCGGTMMYYNALFNGISKLPTSDTQYRQTLNQQWQQSPQKVYQQLQKTDPQRAEKIHPNDQQRTIRALEIYRQSHQTLNSQQHIQISGIRPHLTIAIETPDKKILHQRIENRLDQMLKQGFIKEVQQLLSNNQLDQTAPVFNIVGYKQYISYCLQQINAQTAREKAIIATRQLAKKQMTWMRSIAKNHSFHTIDLQNPKQEQEIIAKITHL